jgi:hypothetical protein
MARPKIYDAEEVAVKLDEYTDSMDYPLITEFCLDKENPSKVHLYEMSVSCEALSNSIKRCCAKQENYVERQVAIGKFNPIFAIFKLKQPAFGWKDKVEQEIKTEMTVEFSLPDSMKKIAE